MSQHHYKNTKMATYKRNRQVIPKTVKEQRVQLQEGFSAINYQKIPDPKLHQFISFIKSGIRIVGYVFIPFDLEVAAGVLVFSEVVGIVEELV